MCLLCDFHSQSCRLISNRRFPSDLTGKTANDDNKLRRMFEPSAAGPGGASARNKKSLAYVPQKTGIETKQIWIFNMPGYWDDGKVHPATAASNLGD